MLSLFHDLPLNPHSNKYFTILFHHRFTLATLSVKNVSPFTKKNSTVTKKKKRHPCFCPTNPSPAPSSNQVPVPTKKYRHVTSIKTRSFSDRLSLLALQMLTRRRLYPSLAAQSHLIRHRHTLTANVSSPQPCSLIIITTRLCTTNP